MGTIVDRIKDIIAKGTDMTLATLRPDGWPQATTVSYASNGLVIFFGTGAKSQKARNLAEDGRVSLTINLPYADWSHIVGLSAAGIASRVVAPKEIERFGAAMLRKFPDIANYVAPEGADGLALFKVEPKIVSLLDYAKGFGHVEIVRLGEMAVPN